MQDLHDRVLSLSLNYWVAQHNQHDIADKTQDWQVDNQNLSDYVLQLIRDMRCR